MESAIIMDIQRYSLHDGPGIRSTVFLKGCHMSCLWCHNPESQHREPEMMYYPELCVGCGGCLGRCTKGAAGEGGIDVHICRDCGQKRECAEACPAEALRVCGSRRTTEEVLRELLRDRSIYGAEGGVTCSGGEPLLQAGFVREIFRLCRREDIGTCIDTTVNVEWSVIESVLALTDLFLVDIKFMSEKLALKYTGAGCGRTFENLRRLSELKKPVYIRTPLIAGVNDIPPESAERERFIGELENVLRADSFYVTDHAGKKYRALQRENWLARQQDKKNISEKGDAE